MPSSIRAHCLHSPSLTLFYLLYTASISVIRRWMRLGFTTSGKCRSFLSNVSLHPTTSLSHTWHLQLPLRRRFGSFLIILPPSLSGTYGTQCAARMRVCACSSLLIILPPPRLSGMFGTRSQCNTMDYRFDRNQRASLVRVEHAGGYILLLRNQFTHAD